MKKSENWNTESWLVPFMLNLTLPYFLTLHQTLFHKSTENYPGFLLTFLYTQCKPSPSAGTRKLHIHTAPEKKQWSQKTPNGFCLDSPIVLSLFTKFSQLLDTKVYSWTTNAALFFWPNTIFLFLQTGPTQVTTTSQLYLYVYTLKGFSLHACASFIRTR